MVIQLMTRHPDLESRVTEKLEVSPAIACTVRGWFDQLLKLMEANEITLAHQIYNADETGFPMISV